ncbi:MAG TPA: diaminopimelate epimerase [Steroidobacteraceae bacterium]|nr:diaminopimelate epimerase [Steroidobacteraceae bacterium]
MAGILFIKMHGLGNDFVVLDARATPIPLDDARARAIADRHTGVGCDQLLVMEPPTQAGADVFMRIRNADGDEVEACGNGTRCIAAVLMRETGKPRVVIETVAGLLEATAASEARVTVDMGPARLGWREIPLARDCDTLHVPLTLGPLADPVATNMGNPHATFFVPDAEAVDVAGLGRELEHHAIFPARANIGVASLAGKDRLRFRVWERGVGITIACGTGACAAGVAAARRGLTGRRVTVVADGGPLEIEWRADGHVLMTGPAAVSFTGTLDPSLLV